MYIDDCIVYRNANEEFISRMRSIFVRFRLHNLFSKATKCKFGYSELDFNSIDLTLTRIQSVLNFPVPYHPKQSKRF